MGLSFRKSIKLGKNVRLNISKNGPSLSLGSKGAKVNISKRGVRTSVGAGGIRYSKNYSFKQNNNSEPRKVIQEQTYDKTVIEDLKVSSPGLPIEVTNKIFKWFGIGILSMIIGATVFPLALLIALPAILYTISIMLFNKVYRSSLMMQKAKAYYKRQQYDKAKKYCYKALDIYKDNHSAAKLLKILEAS